MKYVRLGKSGLKISRIILWVVCSPVLWIFNSDILFRGCMSYGDPAWQGWVLKEEEALKHIKAAYDAGINTFDTANVYSHGVRIHLCGFLLPVAHDHFRSPRGFWGKPSSNSTCPVTRLSFWPRYEETQRTQLNCPIYICVLGLFHGCSQGGRRRLDCNSRTAGSTSLRKSAGIEPKGIFP